MTTTQKQAVFAKGESILINFDLKDVDGSPLDLTGATPTWRVGTLGSAPVLTKGLGTGLTVIGSATNGKLDLNVSPSAHTALTVGTYTHQLHIVLSDGREVIPVQGPLTIIESL